VAEILAALKASKVPVVSVDIPSVLRVHGSGFGVHGSGFRVQGSGFRVYSGGVGPHPLGAPPPTTPTCVCNERGLEWGEYVWGGLAGATEYFGGSEEVRGNVCGLHTRCLTLRRPSLSSLLLLLDSRYRSAKVLEPSAE